MGCFHFFLIFFCTYVSNLFSAQITTSAYYTLTPYESLVDGQTLVSQGETFELGFFSPSNSNNRYLGIWYKTIPVQTVVWVANRDSPLIDTSGVLSISTSGNIVILNGTQFVVWSSNSSKAVKNPILEFLDSGNLVLRDADSQNSDQYIWQSFDYPGNTLLPGMKLGIIKGVNRNLSAWRSSSDPAHGTFTYGVDANSYREIAMRNGSKKIYRAGPWNGIGYSGTPDLKPNSIFSYKVVLNEDEDYYMYELINKSVILKVVLSQSSSDSHLELSTWVDKTQTWGRLVLIPRDRCDDYALCGGYSTCDATAVGVCMCLEGFRPKSPEDWSGTNWSEGCEREAIVNCSEGEGFVKYTGVRLPDTTGAWVNTSMNLEQCRVKCLKNCSCMAYTNSDISGGGSGCILWFGDLIDIRQYTSAGQDIYIRMAASGLGNANRRRKQHVLIIVGITCVAGIIVLGLASWCIWKKRRPEVRTEANDFELPIYDLATLASATNNFSEENKLAEGGFGPVYEGKLNGQQVAVKRLSKSSTQGVEEFKTEVLLIAKLQHKNLVRLLGCCIEGEEMMLIYEYMENKSLESSIFDETKGRLLDWRKRFDIIDGISRGLLYLHHDSRLRIIHRDLKANNILLDREMVPKISDFGIARIFEGAQNEGKTRRVVGTYGYMSPEYLIDGHFSVKSDVFSFGVIVLEIISGKKNRSFAHPDHELNLLGHAWRLWKEERSIELVDNSIKDSCSVKDVLRCIQIGLLCVQRRPEHRPTMSSVVLMLSCETVALPTPREPGFYSKRTTSSLNDDDEVTYLSNEITILAEGR